MGDARLALQRLLPLIEFILELGPLLLLVVLLAVYGRVTAAVPPGVVAPGSSATTTRLAFAVFAARLLAVAFAASLLALAMEQVKQIKE